MKRRILTKSLATLLVCVLLLPLVATSCAPAASAPTAAPKMDTLTKLKTTKYALLASYNEPPHDWFDPTDGKWKGIDNDIVEYILPKLGVEKWDFIVADWSGLIPGLQAGRWDLMSVGMSITDKRKEEIAFSEPIYQYGDCLVVKKGNPKNVKGKADWPGKKIGGILGSTSIDEIKAVSGAEAVPYKTHADMFADVKSGRLDLALADETTTAYAFTVNPEPDLEILHEWEGKKPRPTGIGFRKEDTALKAAFDAELKKMREDGTLLQILQKYGLGEANLIK